jgi:hypothetical protein
MFTSPKNDTQASVLDTLRTKPLLPAAHNILIKNPQYLNAALNDKDILEMLGGTQGVRGLATRSLEICQAIIKSDAYKNFDKNTQEQITQSESNLKKAKLHQNRLGL